MKIRFRATLVALALGLAPLAASAQVAPAAGTPQLSASVPVGAFNLFPYLSASPFSGAIKLALFSASCTPAAATSCTAAAPVPMLATTGAFATQFAAAPLCFDGQGATSVAVLSAASHSFNAAFTTDTPTLIATAATSSLLVANFLCVGP